MDNKKLLYDLNEKPPVWKWIVLAIQHVFAMFGATILVPILVNGIAGETVLTIPVALAASGIGTLIYIACTKGKSPVYLGSSFAYIAPMAAAFGKGGISSVATGVAGAGLIYILFAGLIKLFGKNWIDKILPPVVIGPMIMVIGLALAPTAVQEIGIDGSVAFAWKPVVVALVSFVVTAFVAIGAKGFTKVIPFLIGIASGYILAAIFGLIDFTPVKEASFFSVPAFVLPIKDYTFSASGLLTIMPIALVTIAEHMGDHMALGAIIGKDLVKDPGLDRTLLGDGLATLTAGLLGGPANTTYGENTSVVGMTKVASVWVIGLAAIIAILMAFLGKLTAILGTIPNPVLGGVALLLYGFISVNGLKVLVSNQIDFNNLRNVVIASTMLVLGLGGAVIAINTNNAQVSISGMSLAAFAGIILNLVLPQDKEYDESKDRVNRLGNRLSRKTK